MDTGSPGILPGARAGPRGALPVRRQRPPRTPDYQACAVAAGIPANPVCDNSIACTQDNANRLTQLPESVAGAVRPGAKFHCRDNRVKWLIHGGVFSLRAVYRRGANPNDKSRRIICPCRRRDSE